MKLYLINFYLKIKSKKKHILIFSDGLHFNEENYDILLQNGYIEYPTIYIDIPTFMKIV